LEAVAQINFDNTIKELTCEYESSHAEFVL